MYDEYTLRQIVEKKFSGVVHPDIGNFRSAPTGEDYWSVLSCGIHTNGTAIPKGYSTAAEAVNKFKKWVLSITSALSVYGSGQETLYWRKLPEIKREKNKLRVYSRFLISDKAIIQDSDFNKNKEKA